LCCRRSGSRGATSCWKASESGFSGPAFIFSVRDVDAADQDNFDALLTSDWQPKVARHHFGHARILDEVG
jgi:hypothetical protein